MPRPLRIAVGGIVYHVLNRANGKGRIFCAAGDYRAFEAVLGEACKRTGMRLLAYCVMPSHWHMVVWPRADGDLSVFAGWLTMTHAQRWHAFHGSAGSGHVYQGRFRSFPVQDDNYFLTLCRYVERNAVRAGLVARAQDWPWSSLAAGRRSGIPALSEWPLRRPTDWLDWVNQPLTGAELEAVRTSLARGRPFGDLGWQRRIAAQIGLEATLEGRGRPRGKGS